ncbi:MAG: hypothetical protein ABIP17_17290 [Ilumatobacteraceae bacterium]
MRRVRHRAGTLPTGRRTAAPLLAAALVIALAACDPPTETAATARCSGTVEEASKASETSAQIRLLDRALTTCGSYQVFTDELARYPSIIGYDPATFVELRCNTVTDEDVREGPTCSSVITPVTTAPPTTAVELLFVGDTLDGRVIEIRPGAEIAFDGDVPAVIQQTVNIAIESKCDGVIAQRDLWAGQVDDSPAGDIASVYAQHAQNVADYINCDASPLDIGAADESSDG